MNLNLHDKVALVTGGASGLGAAIAADLHGEGAKIALLDVDTAKAEAVVDTIDRSRKRAVACKADVVDMEQVQTSVDRILELFGSIDILVNSAGILMSRPIEEISVEDFERVIRVNLTGTFIMCKAVVPVMKKQRRGKIVNIASLGGRTGRPGVGVSYAASKSGVIGLTQTLARELGKYGIYANSVAPGPIMTEMTLKAPQELFAVWRASRAVDRDGIPKDVADAVLFLASDMSDWVTGATLDVNGGIYIG
ncbi:MAG: 3-oxoacyl-ACP reductase FabG [Desulfobacteraceae bacterium]|nr:MAG: 3-oxoacyl-ACP reductase FabG [Desulfobacteraceae bacterium]